jgi:hypothetical protein
MGWYIKKSGTKASSTRKLLLSRPSRVPLSQHDQAHRLLSIAALPNWLCCLLKEAAIILGVLVPTLTLPSSLLTYAGIKRFDPGWNNR